MQIRIGALSPQYQNDSESLLFRIYVVQNVANGTCDFIAQCILVRIKKTIVPIICFIHLNHLQRSSVVGSCGVKIFVS
jgi:hypothetical protein